MKVCTDCLVAVKSTLTLWYFHRNSGGCTKPVKPRRSHWLEAASIVLTVCWVRVPNNTPPFVLFGLLTLPLDLFALAILRLPAQTSCRWLGGSGSPCAIFPSLLESLTTPASGPSQLSEPVQLKPPLSWLSSLGLSKTYPSFSFLFWPSPIKSMLFCTPSCAFFVLFRIVSNSSMYWSTLSCLGLRSCSVWSQVPRKLVTWTIVVHRPVLYVKKKRILLYYGPMDSNRLSDQHARHLWYSVSYYFKVRRQWLS